MQARLVPALAVAVVVVCCSASAAAQSAWPAAGIRRVVPAAGGLDALEVKVDLTGAAPTLRARRCKTADCGDASAGGAGGAGEIAIGIDKTRIDPASVTIDLVPIGQGRTVAHVRVPDRERKDLAFEAVLSGKEEAPLFAGLTGYTRGDEGDRAGALVLVKEGEGASRFVIVAETREDTRICGQASTPIGARGVDPRTMRLVGATLPRVDKKAREGASRVVAEVRASAVSPLGRVLSATGGSSPNAPAMTDGRPDTAWSEARTSGDGHGEFATMRVPSELPIHGLVVTVAPPQPKPEGAAPKTFFVATDNQLFHVTMPEDAWSKPGQAYDIKLPEPVKTTCLAIVLDEAYGRGAANPEVSIAEIAALTKFDAEGAKLEDVAKALSSPRGDEAAALLKRAGDDGLAAVAKELPSLDPRGRALAVDVAASAGACAGPAIDMLVGALGDREVEVKRRALGRIERCGKAAGESLALAVRSEDEKRRAAAAPLLATVAPSLAIEPLADQMGKGSPETRRAVRGAFARAAGGSTRDKLLGLLARRELPLVARLDLLRAMGPKVAELRPEADVAIADILRASPDMPTRYLLAQPLAHLARAPDATSGELSRLAELARRDPEWAVRARAVELSAGIAPLAPTLVAAAADPAPRVREAALKAIGQTAQPAGAAAAAQALASDEWTFVRVAAAEAIGKLPQDERTSNALGAALGDASPRVRASVISAIARQRATGLAGKVRERLDDTREDPEVRAMAARTLGAMCVQNTADRLTKLAHLSRAPVDEADERVGMAAIEALGALHPADLAERLAPLRAKEVRLPVRRAAERALAEPSACR